MVWPKEFDNETVNSHDNVDLIHIILKRISRQDVITEEDRRIMTHLNECLYQFNLKKQNQNPKKNKDEWESF